MVQIDISSLEDFRNFFQQFPFPQAYLQADKLEFVFTEELLKRAEELKKIYVEGMVYIFDEAITKVRAIESNPIFTLTSQDIAQIICFKMLNWLNNRKGSIEYEMRYWWQFITPEQQHLVNLQLIEYENEYVKLPMEAEMPDLENYISQHPGIDRQKYLRERAEMWASGCHSTHIKSIISTCQMDIATRQQSARRDEVTKPILTQFHLPPPVIDIVNAYAEVQCQPVKRMVVIGKGGMQSVLV